MKVQNRMLWCGLLFSTVCGLHCATAEPPDAETLIAQLRSVCRQDPFDQESYRSVYEPLQHMMQEKDPGVQTFVDEVIEESRTRTLSDWAELSPDERLEDVCVEAFSFSVLTKSASFTQYAEWAIAAEDTARRFKESIVRAIGGRLFSDAHRGRPRDLRLVMLLHRAAKDDDTSLRRIAFFELTGVIGGVVRSDGWDREWAVQALKRYADDTSVSLWDRQWCISPLVALKAPGYEKYLDELERFVGDKDELDFQRLHLAEQLLKWGRIDKTVLDKLKKEERDDRAAAARAAGVTKIKIGPAEDETP